MLTFSQNAWYDKCPLNTICTVFMIIMLSSLQIVIYLMKRLNWSSSGWVIYLNWNFLIVFFVFYALHRHIHGQLCSLSSQTPNELEPVASVTLILCATNSTSFAMWALGLSTLHYLHLYSMINILCNPPFV